MAYGDSGRAGTALLAATAASGALYLLQWAVPAAALLAWPLVLLSTLAHELGHGLTALALGGTLDSLSIYADASGVAQHHGAGSTLAQAAIAAGGPLGPPLAAYGLFAAAREPRRARLALGAAAVLFLLACLLWVRNPFGLGFVALLGAGLGWLALRGGATANQACAAFLALQLSLAAFARADYLFTASAETAAGVMPSDTALLAAALWLPYWAWGAAIAALSLLVLWTGLRGFLRAASRSGAPRP